MRFMRLREYLPKSLFGRALLILVLPIVVIQVTVGGIFADRIFNEMTGIMSSNYVRAINQVTGDYVSSTNKEAVVERAAELGLQLSAEANLPDRPLNQRNFFDLSGLYIERALSDAVVGLKAMELEPVSPLRVYLWVERDEQMLQLVFPRRFVSARNPHQLPVIMVLTSLLLTAISVVFLRNQITPIKELAEAADAFGQGRMLPMRPRGASEVRRAARAFLDMRSRIDRHIDQRTLMLSGVSHDLRTPLTRLKLGLSMLSDTKEDTHELTKDISDMENIIDEFLSFAGEDQDEGWERVNPGNFLADIINRTKPMLGDGREIKYVSGIDDDLTVIWRTTAMSRAVTNLIGNAMRFGSSIEVSLTGDKKWLRITIEDDGPGIHPDEREAALNAFVRLDAARNQNKGGGAGLGLAIAKDIIHSHGGKLELSRSRKLGGLCCTLTLPILQDQPSSGFRFGTAIDN